MEIRELASPTDLAAADRVIARAWQAAYADIVSADAIERVQALAEAADHEARFDALASLEGARSLLAVADDSPVGCAGVIWDPEATKAFVGGGAAEIRILYVDPAHWREGVGTRLLRACLEAVPATCDRLLLETFVENEVGRSFYDSRGFEVVDRSEYAVAGEAYPTVVYARPLDEPS